jgi:hypothetical protein
MNDNFQHILMGYLLIIIAQTAFITTFFVDSTLQVVANSLIVLVSVSAAIYLLVKVANNLWGGLPI